MAQPNSHTACLDAIIHLVDSLGCRLALLALPAEPPSTQQRHPSCGCSSAQPRLQPSVQRAERAEAAYAGHRLLHSRQAWRGGAERAAGQLLQGRGGGAGRLGSGVRLLQGGQLLHPLDSQLACTGRRLLCPAAVRQGRRHVSAQCSLLVPSEELVPSGG